MIGIAVDISSSALCVSTRVALLAAFFEDEGALAAFGAQIADAFGHGLRGRRFLHLGYPQMLSQDLGNGIRQGPNAGATISQMSPATDAFELCRDLAQTLRRC